VEFSERSTSKQQGFSLIELMVIILIVGVLVTITWNQIARLAPRYRLEGAARSVAAEIQKARGRAIAETKCVMVDIDANTKTYAIGTAASVATCPTASGSYTFATAQKIEDSGTIGIENAVNAGSPIVDPIFSARGLNSQTSTIRFFNNLGDGRSVQVNAIGRVNVQ
jgi:prepilin-type N-terminal cleavage/methylation domain-containing protein